MRMYGAGGYNAVSGWLSSPFLENKMFGIPALFSGVLSAPALVIVPYLIISWVFYDYFYN